MKIMMGEPGTFGLSRVALVDEPVVPADIPDLEQQPGANVNAPLSSESAFTSSTTVWMTQSAPARRASASIFSGVRAESWARSIDGETFAAFKARVSPSILNWRAMNSACCRCRMTACRAASMFAASAVVSRAGSSSTPVSLGTTRTGDSAGPSARAVVPPDNTIKLARAAKRAVLK